MDITSLLDSLNNAQRQAVSSEHNHTLVLAGAGSGKTRVLVHRIAWFMMVYGLMPSQIMAVTFTNKAATEIKNRIAQLHPHHVSGMWLGTFHSISHKILRIYHGTLGLNEHFTILDSDDTLRAIKKTLAHLNLDETKFNPKMLQNLIGQAKENRVMPESMPSANMYQQQLKTIYATYMQLCKKNNWLDFTDLLLYTITLLTEHPEIRHTIHQRIGAIAIDEFQDINALQYAWFEAFYHDNIHTLCVGDDDQSIYSWRGARAELMTRYQNDYPDVLTIRLEQNYRSTPIILEAANHVIAHNVQRLGKNLWTDAKEGSPIYVFKAYSDYDESKFVLETIIDNIQKGHRPQDIAILYRSNAQSRLFEEQCHAYGLPYRIYAGQRFFDRGEIKDVLAYLRLAFFPEDTAALERIINTPNRGIGHQTLAQLRHYATTENVTLLASIQARSIHQPHLKLTQALQSFLHDIDAMHTATQILQGRELAENIIERSQLIPYIQRTEKEHENKCDNIRELLDAITQFTTQEDGTLLSFIQHAALMHADDTTPTQDAISLMTLHAAKGLEFETVFIVGAEEEILPHKASFTEKNGLEEERRLCYVGMTRARQQLFITYAECRRLYGAQTYQRPSRFIQEIPPHCLSYIRPDLTTTQTNKAEYTIGQIVRHERFGEGSIISIEGQSPHTRMLVDFEHNNTKWFLCEYTDLTIIS